ncbi:GspE/PulE family protein [Symbiobacterium terraclitae]|uniref:GspE/PulE family protein n=1 Tax=Symbiobacterium terraclitae TaxID=557451 RepID=UPI0035B53D26
MAPQGVRGSLRLGDILVNAGLITRSQLARGLEEQKASGERLGSVLIRLGYVTEFDMASVLAEQLGYPFIPNPAAQIDPDVVALVSEEMAKQHQAVPIRLEGNALLVAMADPLNFLALDDISLACGRRVKPAVSPGKAIQRALLRAYANKGGDDDLEAAGAGDAGLQGPQPYDLEEADDSGVVRRVNGLLVQALGMRATDIHIEPAEQQVRVRFRVDGQLLSGPSFLRQAYPGVLSRLKVMAGMDIAERRLPQDGRIEVELQGRRLDLRVNTLPTIYGEKVAIRILDQSAAVLGLGELGISPDILPEVRRLLAKPHGLFLVTGPTGSGKSTTLLGALTELNDATRQILTIEDPVEYHLEGINQVQVNPKAGLTFAAGLRAFLRQDPDVMMVGEIRDRDTVDVAVRAALTGHLVLSTLHTNSAAATPSRLIDMGAEPFLLASALTGVLAQRLVRRLCQRCKQPYVPDPDDPDYLLLEAEGLAGAPLYRPGGCIYCDNTGFTGRMAIAELMVVAGEVRRLIAQRATSTEIEAAARAAGMRTLWQDGLDKAVRGLTTLEQVKRVALVEE